MASEGLEASENIESRLMVSVLDLETLELEMIWTLELETGRWGPTLDLPSQYANLHQVTSTMKKYLDKIFYETIFSEFENHRIVFIAIISMML